MNFKRIPINQSYIVFIFFSLLLFACETDMIVDFELPEPEKKLVLQSTIAPFTPPYLSPFRVQLWSTLPILDTTKSKQLTDAQVIWYEDENIKDTLIFSSVIDGYTTPDFYFPELGKKYDIKVQREGFKSLSASCYIPDKVKISEVKILSLAGVDNDGLAYSAVSISFHDTERLSNFYEIIVTEVSNENAKFRLWTNDKIIANESYYPSILSFEKKMPNRLLFNDKQFNGNIKNIVLYFTPEQEISKGQQKIKFSYIDVYLRSVSEEYYKYFTTLIQHQYNQKGDFFYGLGEPLNVFSNVYGGYGIFAGFQNEAVTCIVDSVNFN